MLPLAPDAECFFGPRAKRYGFNHGWGDDFFARETSPRHWVEALFVRGLEVAGVVASKIRDFFVLIEFGLETLPVFVGAEKLDKGLW